MRQCCVVMGYSDSAYGYWGPAAQAGSGALVAVRGSAAQGGP